MINHSAILRIIRPVIDIAIPTAIDQPNRSRPIIRLLSPVRVRAIARIPRQPRRKLEEPSIGDR